MSRRKLRNPSAPLEKVVFKQRDEGGVVLSGCWPGEVVLTVGTSSDSMCECPNCGLSNIQAWDREIEVWRYDTNNEGSGIWVRAVCNECGHVELFETTGGAGGTGSVRRLRDVGRKHRDAVSTYEDKVKRGQIEGEYPYILLPGGEE